MKTVDTNILARFLLNDDPHQSPIAESIIASGVYVPLTVLLELGWLLRSRYDFDRAYLTATLGDLIDMPTINVEAEPAVRLALVNYAKGGDFADYIHMIAAKGTEAFVTFDASVMGGEDIGVSVELV